MKTEQEIYKDFQQATLQGKILGMKDAEIICYKEATSSFTEGNNLQGERLIIAAEKIESACQKLLEELAKIKEVKND